MSRTFLPHVITDDSALGGAEIERSFRFNDDDSAYLQRQPSSNTSGSSQKITISFWIKLGNIPSGTNGGTFFGTSGDNHRGQFFNQEFYFGNANYWINTTALVRDLSSWYHVVYVVDTTQGTTSNRQKIYVNGVLQDRGDTISDPSQNATFDYFNNSSQTYYIGRRQSGNYFDGYLAEIHFIDGYAYDASYFGYTEQQTGIWRHKKVTGITYGTNGFYLDFSDNSSITNICLDKSGNANNFSPDNCSTEDSMLDTPTNVFCTQNPFDDDYTSVSTFSQGNLYASRGSSNHGSNRGTIGMSSGKWYFEYCLPTATHGSASFWGGVCNSTADMTVSRTNGMWNYGGSNGEFIVRGTGNTGIHNYGSDIAAGTVVGVAVDMDNKKIWLAKNNTWFGSSNADTDGNPSTGDNPTSTFTDSQIPDGNLYPQMGLYNYAAKANFGQDSTFSGTKTRQGNTDANGIGDFFYAPPTGFKALCSKNLPPNVPSIIRPQRNFETLLYTGNGSTSQNITGLEFTPDFVWIKSRSNGSGHHSLMDSVRSGILGYDAALNSNSQIAEYSVDAFTINDNNSIDVPYYDNDYSMNTNSATYVAWCWKAGGAAVTNTVGNISAQVSANDEAGFSIITYTGDGNTSGNVGTGLRSTQPLDWAIVKRRDNTSDWQVGHRASGQSNNFAYHTNLNDTSSLSGSSPYHMGTQNATNGDRLYLAEGGLTSSATYVAYVWQERPGYSKFGSYTGNGSADGPFIHLGFRPAWFLQKKTSGTGSWYLFDNKRSGFNVDNDMLSPNLTDGEYDGQTYPRLDFLSNGIKWRDAGSSVHNASGATYIYMAFAEQPGFTNFDTFPNAR